MTDLEHLLRETFDQDAAGYDVSPGALAELRLRIRGAGHKGQASRRHRHYGRAVLAVGVAAAIAVIAVAIPATTSGRHEETPAVLGVSSTPPTDSAATTITPAAPQLPSAVTAAITNVALGFSLDRLTLAGPDIWAFGHDSALHPKVAHLLNDKVVLEATLPAPVCSASVGDLSTGIAVVLGKDHLCVQRSTLRLMNPESLTLSAPATAAIGGDALVRGEGDYVVSAGVVSLVDSATLAPLGPSLRLGSAGSLINLANDPNQQSMFATVYDPLKHTTRLVTFQRNDLTLTRTATLTAAYGSLPYATDGGAVWVSLFIIGGQTSQAQLRDGRGRSVATAFPGSEFQTNFAESGSRLWSLSQEGVLTCASLKTGAAMGQSTVAAVPSGLAADADNVYVGDAQTKSLDILTPANDCAANGRMGR